MLNLDEVRQRFINAIEQFDPRAKQTLNSALQMAEKEHAGQCRKQHKTRQENDVDPYLIHPLRVSLVLIEELSLCDETAVASAILHDVVEDGNSRPSNQDIANKFGMEIAETVRYLTKPESSDGTPLSAEDLHPYHESFLSAPLHVRLVKLSDRLDNIRETLLIDRPKFQNRYLKETREIYLPLAKQTSLFFTAQLKEKCDQLEALIA